MAKILLTADVHFGLPNKLNDILWAMNTIREYARTNNIDTIVVLGDLFHDRVNYNIEVFNAVYSFFEEAKELDQSWVCLLGNHDQYLRHSWKINSLRPLNNVITVIDAVKMIKIGNQRFWIIPFIHYESVYMKVLKKVEEQYEDGDILLTHVGVHNAILNECFLIKNWSIVNFDDSKFDLVFTGHFHCHQSVGEFKNTHYPGSPIPFRFDEGMVPHGFLEFDLDTRDTQFVEIFGLNLVDGPRPPDYITVPDDMLDDELIVSGDNVRVQLTRDYSKDEQLRIRKSLLDQGAVNVKLQMIKEEKIDLAANAKSDVSLLSPIDLFNKWLDHDKPKKLDLDLLKKLNNSIINTGS